MSSSTTSVSPSSSQVTNVGLQKGKKKHSLPNILITGTPGVGKTSLAEKICKIVNQKFLIKEDVQYEVLSVSKIALENKFLENYDDSFETYNINEDDILDYMEDELDIDTRGGYIVEYHSSEWFPERWFDLIVVLTCELKTLTKRLESRQYSDKKVQDNLQCEIWQICKEEAQNSYKQEIIKTFSSNSIEDMNTNCDEIVKFIESWIKQ